MAKNCSMFIFDHTVLKREEDDLKDAILYFCPYNVSSDGQCALVGKIIGISDFLTEMLPKSPPKIIKLKTEKFAMKRTGCYSIGLGGSLSVADKFLLAHLEFVWNTFVFFQGGLSAIKQRYKKQMFLQELSKIWNIYLPFCQCYSDNLSQAFQVLPTVKLDKNDGNVFLHASHILQRSCRQDSAVLGGALVYDSKVICTQLSPEITKRFLLLKPQQTHLPCLPIKVDFEKPESLRLLRVFLTEKEYRQISVRRTKSVKKKNTGASCASHFDSDIFLQDGLNLTTLPTVHCSTASAMETSFDFSKYQDSAPLPCESVSTMTESNNGKNEICKDGEMQTSDRENLPSASSVKVSSSEGNSCMTVNVFDESLINQPRLEQCHNKPLNIHKNEPPSNEITSSVVHSKPETYDKNFKSLRIEVSGTEKNKKIMELSSDKSSVEKCHEPHPKHFKVHHVGSATASKSSVENSLNSGSKENTGNEQGASDRTDNTYCSETQGDKVKIEKEHASKSQNVRDSRVSKHGSDSEDNTNSKHGSDKQDYIKSECGSESRDNNSANSKHGSNTQENDNKNSKHGSDSQDKDNTNNEHGSDTQDCHNTKSKHGSDTQKNDSTNSKHDSDTQNSSNTNSKHDSDTQDIDNTNSKHGSDTQNSDNTNSKHGSGTQDNDNIHSKAGASESRSELKPQTDNVPGECMVSPPLTVVDHMYHSLIASGSMSSYSHSSKDNSFEALSPESLTSTSEEKISSHKESFHFSQSSDVSATPVQPAGSSSEGEKIFPVLSGDIPHRSNTYRIKTNEEEWNPAAEGLVDLVLYVQGHSNMLLLLLLDNGCTCDKILIRKLLKFALPNLAELDFQVKDFDQQPQNEAQTHRKNYSFLRNDPFSKIMTGNVMDSVTGTCHEFVDTATKIHEHFEELDTMTEATFCSHKAAVYGHRSVNQETFFQLNNPKQPPGRYPTSKDESFTLDTTARKKLQTDHDISLL